MDGLIAALGTAALGTTFVFDFVADGPPAPSCRSPQRSPTRSSTSPCSRGRRRRRAHRLAPGTDLDAAAGRARHAGLRRHRLHPRVGRRRASSGDWIEPIYLISAVHPRGVVWRPAGGDDPASGPHRGRRELMVPAISPRSSSAFSRCSTSPLQAGSRALLAAATVIAILARLAMSVRENKTLLEHAQTDCAHLARQPQQHADRPRTRVRASPTAASRSFAGPSTSTVSSSTTTPSATRPATRSSAASGSGCATPSATTERHTGSAATSSAPLHCSGGTVRDVARGGAGSA